LASKANPNEIDYNEDEDINALDDALAVQDANKDGRLTDKEKAAYKQKQGETVQEVVTDPKTGKQTIKTKGPKPAPEPTLTAGDYGYNEDFLKAHPDVDDAINRAIRNDWTQDQLNKFIENKTEFGRSTTDAQAKFDIDFAGDKKEDLLRQVEDRTAELKQQAMAAGVQLTDTEASEFAKRAVRSQLTSQDTLAFLSDKFALPGAEAEGAPKATTPAGQSAQIVDEIRSMARSYGITVTDQFIQQKVREGMTQGAGWQTWLEGQRNVFRSQAKNLYPTVADKFDEFTLGDILQPYLNDASELTGINISQMNYDDPIWTAPLNGTNGPMNRDEWIRTVKTDKKYGYDGTVRARNEYTELADDLLAAFGMA
jgi:uncharacterized protein YecA (UPF0149 family)